MKINRIEESNKKGCKVSIEKKQFADVLKSSINELSCLLNREKYGAISMQTWKKRMREVRMREVLLMRKV